MWFGCNSVPYVEYKFWYKIIRSQYINVFYDNINNFHEKVGKIRFSKFSKFAIYNIWEQQFYMYFAYKRSSTKSQEPSIIFSFCLFYIISRVQSDNIWHKSLKFVLKFQWESFTYESSLPYLNTWAKYIENLIFDKFQIP